MPPRKKRTLTEEHKKALAKGRAKAAADRAKAEDQERKAAMKAEAADIDERVAKAEEQYAKALDKALRAVSIPDIEKAFNAADRAQNGLMALLIRRREITQELS